MTMTLCTLAVVVPLLALTVAASRVSELEDTREHTVHLLVTRHGLSCANMVEKWISSYDWGRGGMLDPLLGNVGAHTSKLAAEEVKTWLRNKNLSVDALVSSHIGRAMETGLRMYPMISQLYAVPYIREHASGDSNKPAERVKQLQNLISALGDSSFVVDYRWIDVFGGDFGTWSQFLNFLKQSFLPDLVEKLKKPSGSPIVIGVVTHSKFMRDSDVGTHCHRHWDSKSDDGKPLNNQVLDLTYKFMVAKQPADLDSTPKYILNRDSQPCEEVAGTQPLENAAFRHTGRICLSDVGDVCLQPILDTANWPQTLIRNTDEHNILENVRQAIPLQKEVENAKSAVDSISRQQVALSKIGDINCVGDGMGCQPAKYCQRPNIGMGSCTLKSDFRVDKLSTRLQQAQQTVKTKAAQLSTLMQNIELAMKKECWTGGHPQPLKLPSSEKLLGFKFGKPLRDFLTGLGKD